MTVSALAGWRGGPHNETNRKAALGGERFFGAQAPVQNDRGREQPENGGVPGERPHNSGLPAKKQLPAGNRALRGSRR